MTEDVGQLLVEDRVLDEWIDRNEHMNVAYYVLAFDLAIDVLWASLGMDDRYVDTRNFSTFAVESHVTWVQEMPRAAPYRITSQLLAFDSKLIHHFQHMYHAEEGYLAATAEWMNLHIDLGERRVSPWPTDILERMELRFAAQLAREKPTRAGAEMCVKSPLQCVDDYVRTSTIDHGD